MAMDATGALNKIPHNKHTNEHTEEQTNSGTSSQTLIDFKTQI
jgi:hypothetical protein